ncbi:MAG: hypothetical protein A2289_07910 [Deltaproteobacteria bacterium RIFOXYA12_FULL_58_15]|nr:MAG: hypothetical protein A2289_07910 [Deltaproteobacteria bacterium RIFOXYA12_FULL_58_15]OGR14348.1 MAG: hypothetical protein A2341_10550 [Deltaproteobacteria bacterium RIFOXYB12_FULL_58_9]
MKKILSVLAVGGFVFAAGCGNDNAEACKSYVDKVQDCGGTYASTYNDGWCDAFDESDCDVADYFNCLEDALGSCTNGDFSGVDNTALAACAAKATCD